MLVVLVRAFYCGKRRRYLLALPFAQDHMRVFNFDVDCSDQTPPSENPRLGLPLFFLMAASFKLEILIET